MKKYDVAVVGGGPIGSYVAHRMAVMGYSVVVVERRGNYGDRICCTGLVSQECVNTFAIADDIILRQANSATLFSPGGRVFEVWRAEPQASIIDRVGLDLAIVKRAVDSGVEYVMGGTVGDIQIDGDRVRIEAGHEDEQVNFEVKAAIIATGFGSNLPEKLGMGKVGDFVIGVQAEVEALDLEGVEVYFGRQVAPGFFAWAVPTSKGKALVGMLSRRQHGFYLRKFLTHLTSQGKITPTEAEVLYRGISIKPPPRTYGNRLVVIGDAAGQVKPTTGGGIYYGWLCADIAAEKLRQAFSEGDLSARSLASYERAWKNKIGWELRMRRWARKVYERLSDGQVDLAIDIMKSSGIDKVLREREDLRFDSHGKVVLSLIRHGLLSKIGGVVSSSPPRHSS